MKKPVLIAGLLLSGSTLAGEYDAIVAKAIRAISDDYHNRWAFTESKLEDGLEYVGRFDPRRPQGERWILLNVDGRAPSEEEIDDFLEDKEDEFQWDDDEFDGTEVDMVDLESLELVEETDDHWLFRFAPNADDADDDIAAEFLEEVTATLKIDRDGHYLQSIDLYNEKPIRPAFSVRISQFRVHLAFGPAADGGPVVPLAENVMISGRALLLVKFDESESVRYYDYEFAGD